MRVDLLSTDCPGIPSYTGGGVATFLDHMTALLAAEGDELRIVVVQEDPKPIDEEWRRKYAERGVEVVFATPRHPTVTTYTGVWPLRMCEEVTRLVARSDLVYMQDWGGFGFHAIRTARFAGGRRPLFVNVLHGASSWIREGNGQFPESLDHLVLGYIERYAHHHCDLVASPTRYMVDYARSIGWTRPEGDQARVLGLPWVRSRIDGKQPVDRGTPLRKLIFFGRQESRKGFEIFIAALERLGRERSDLIRGIDEVVLLGRDFDNRIGSSADALAILAQAGLSARCVDDLDSPSAVRFLAHHADESLVVIPSVLDNHPYTVVEASMVPGLNMICSDVGGIPEILGKRGAHQFFHADVSSCTAKIAECLERGNLPDGERGHYDPDAANERWLAFHREAREAAARIRPRESSRRGTIDICIATFNDARLLPQLLLSLERQTCPDFQVIVMDDGSTDPDALSILAEMKSHYEPRGWKFLRQENAFVDAARNAAVRAGDSEYLCFCDVDDVMAPNLVERLLDSIERSGADCLMTCYTGFEGDDFPLHPSTGELVAEPIVHKRPVGVDPVLSLVHPDVLGSPVAIIRRSAYETVGGFTEIPGAGHEDYELFIKLQMAGFDVDVLPEHLHIKREVPTSLSKTMSIYAAKRRVIDAYEKKLEPIGLQGMAATLFGATQQVKALQRELYAKGYTRTETGLRRLYHQLVPMSVQRPVRGIRLGLLRHRTRLRADLRWRWLGLSGSAAGLDENIRTQLRSQNCLSFEDQQAILRSRVRHGPAVVGTVRDKLTVLLLSYSRMENIDPIVSSTLRCKFVERVVVSNNNPDVDIDQWVQNHDSRVELINQTQRQGAGLRWRLAAQRPGEHFIAIDDDIFLYPEQIEGLFRHLVQRPEVPHGFFGSRGHVVDAAGPSVQWNRDVDVDVLHQLYAVTRRHVEVYFRILEEVGQLSHDSADLIEWSGDDILISKTGSARPRIHDLGPVLQCPTANLGSVAVHKRDAFLGKRRRIMSDIDRAVASLGGSPGRSSDSL